MGEKQKERSRLVDAVSFFQSEKNDFFDFDFFRTRKETQQRSVFFSKKGITEDFFTEDSKLYITPREYRRMRNGETILARSHWVDSAARKQMNQFVRPVNEADLAYARISRKYSNLRNYLYDLMRGSIEGVSPAKMWNLSLVGAVMFGMLTMTMIYKYLGQNVSAKIQEKKNAVEVERQIAGEYNKKLIYGENEGADNEISSEYITKLVDVKNKETSIAAFEKEIRGLVKGYPIEKMAPEIAKKDRIVAAFLVAIAKKESNWGKRVPVLNGQDCYNYWGYRGIRDRMGTGGHTCFDSTKDAVDTVGKRIEFLVSSKKLNTPNKMVIWKCGSSCSWDSQSAVNKWIADVDQYFQKLNKK